MFGIMASQITGHLVTSSYESIQTVTVGAGGQSSISFTSIPSTYKHLQIRFMGRSTNADTQDNLFINFNSDSGSNYTYHAVYGDGSSASAISATSQTKAITGRLAAANATSGIFGVGVIDILDYANISKYKTLRNLVGVDTNGAGNVWLFSNLWMSTSAISNIAITTASATNFAQYSSFALYGCK
jgi:hypothetical protein